LIRFGARRMPKAYSGQVRQRAIAQMEGGASRREAAEGFEISASTAISWVKCFRATGRCAAMGGSISPLKKHSSSLLGQESCACASPKRPHPASDQAVGRGIGRRSPLLPRCVAMECEPRWGPDTVGRRLGICFRSLNHQQYIAARLSITTMSLRLSVATGPGVAHRFMKIGGYDPPITALLGNLYANEFE